MTKTIYYVLFLIAAVSFTGCGCANQILSNTGKTITNAVNKNYNGIINTVVSIIQSKCWKGSSSRGAQDALVVQVSKKSADGKEEVIFTDNSHTISTLEAGQKTKANIELEIAEGGNYTVKVYITDNTSVPTAATLIKTFDVNTTGTSRGKGVSLKSFKYE